MHFVSVEFLSKIIQCLPFQWKYQFLTVSVKFKEAANKFLGLISSLTQLRYLVIASCRVHEHESQLTTEELGEFKIRNTVNGKLRFEFHQRKWEPDSE